MERQTKINKMKMSICNDFRLMKSTMKRISRQLVIYFDILTKLCLNNTIQYKLNKTNDVN